MDTEKLMQSVTPISKDEEIISSMSKSVVNLEKVLCSESFSVEKQDPYKSVIKRFGFPILRIYLAGGNLLCRLFSLSDHRFELRRFGVKR